MSELDLNRTKTIREDFCRAGAGEPKNWTLDQLRTLCRATEQWSGDTVVTTARGGVGLPVDDRCYEPFTHVRLGQIEGGTIDVGGGLLVEHRIKPPLVDPPVKRRRDVVGPEGQGFA